MSHTLLKINCEIQMANGNSNKNGAVPKITFVTKDFDGKPVYKVRAAALKELILFLDNQIINQSEKNKALPGFFLGKALLKAKNISAADWIRIWTLSLDKVPEEEE